MTVAIILGKSFRNIGNQNHTRSILTGFFQPINQLAVFISNIISDYAYKIR